MPPFGRPAGEVRKALAASFAERAPCGWRDALPGVGVSPSSYSEVLLVRRTVENMARAGELVRVGSHKPAGSRVYHALYEPAEPDADMPAESSNHQALEVVTRSWASFV